MQDLSKGDIVFLVFAAIALLCFGATDAGFSTYFLFLLVCASMWTARRAKLDALAKTSALQEEIRKEQRRGDELEVRLTRRFSQLEAKLTSSVLEPSAAVPPPPTLAPKFSAASATSTTASLGAAVVAAPQRPASTPAIPNAGAQVRETSRKPVFASVETSTDWASRVRQLLDFEQMLGTNWLSKLGVAVLVLGIAFFLAWQLRELGPLGKVVVGLVVSGILLAAGVWGERFEPYRLLARAAIAGGWPLLFFISYAAYHIKAAHVVSSPLFDLVLMFAVVVAMVWHTLRFRSQVITGLAFVLAFATVALNRVDVYSLSANVILAAGLCFVAVRMEWFELEIFGIMAAYFNHYLWLIPIIEPMGGKVHPFPQFYASAMMLLLYWAVFRASYVLRPPVNETISAVAGVLNTVLLLSVMKYQSAHPELAFWALLTLGIVELALAQFTKARQKRISFVVLSTIGLALVLAAIPFRYAPDYVSPIWLLEAELFFVVGVVTAERAFRRLGYVAATATAIQLFAIHGARVYGARMDGAYVVHHWTLGVIFAAAMVALYADSNWAPRRSPDLFSASIDQRFAEYLTYTAAAMGLLSGWVMFPEAGAAVVWIALAVSLAWAGKRYAIPQLTAQANILGLLAVIRCVLVNLPSGTIALPAHVTYRLLTVSAVAVLTYLLSRWNRGNDLTFTSGMPQAATWAASMLVSLLVWYEFRPVSVAIAWCIFGIALFEIGDFQHSLNLRFQAYVALAASFVRVFIVNLNAEEVSAKIGPRVYTIVPIAISLLYVHQRLHESDGSNRKEERDFKLASLFAWCGVLSVAALLRFEVAPDLVAMTWAGATVLLVALSYGLKRRVFLHIGLALGFATVFRAVLHDLYERSYFPWPGKLDAWLVVGGTVALLLVSLPFAFRLRRMNTPDSPELWRRVLGWLDSRPEQILFFLPLILATSLLATEMRRGMLTVAWGIEAVIVFVFALWVKERSYRVAGLALLLLCVGKIFILDFWSLGIRDKALTGIIMGLALIGVSVLYTNRRDTIRQLL